MPRSLFTTPEIPNKSSEKQQNYLQILFTDLGYSLIQRNARLTADLGREIKHLDELTKTEAMNLIQQLKDEKEEDRRDWEEENADWHPASPDNWRNRD